MKNTYRILIGKPKGRCNFEYVGVDRRIIVKSYSLPGLKHCVDIGLLHGFVTVIFSSVGSLAPLPNPTWWTRDYISSGPSTVT
jgi:hypothetical protein